MSQPDRRLVRTSLVVDRGHYEETVAEAILGAEVSVWIATANVKDVHVEAQVGTRARARGTCPCSNGSWTSRAAASR